jgi:nitrite reductase/ring-hydroxylating ferredoxin subunit
MPHVLHPTTDIDQVMAKDPAGDEIILVKQAGTIHAYKNSCPHIGVGLDYGTGQCRSGPDELMCSLHGAIFIASTGKCIDGPCYGASLDRVAIKIDDGKIVLAQ